MAKEKNAGKEVHEGSQIQGVASARGSLSQDIICLIEQDDAKGLEAALLVEKEQHGGLAGAKKKQSRKTSSKKKAAKEQPPPSASQPEYDALLQEVLRHSCIIDAADCLRLLLEDSIDNVTVDADVVYEPDGTTPLHHASRHHSTQCLLLLFQHKVDTSMLNYDNRCPLEEALYSPQLQVDWDASTSAANILGQLRDKDLSAVEVIAENSKDLLVRVAFRCADALQLASLVCLLLVTHGRILNCVARGPDYLSDGPSASGTLVDFIITKALEHRGPYVKTSEQALEGESTGVGHTERMAALKILESLLLFNPRLSVQPGSTESPPMIRAAMANDGALMDLLLGAGAPVNETDGEGNSCLHWVLRQATPLNNRVVDTRLVRRLLKGGANVLLGNKLGATPVHTAAGHGHTEALSVILEGNPAGANVIAATKETPLHYAVKNNHFECAKLLLRHGANRNVVNTRGQKAGQLAASPEMRELLGEPEPPAGAAPAPATAPPPSDAKTSEEGDWQEIPSSWISNSGHTALSREQFLALQPPSKEGPTLGNPFKTRLCTHYERMGSCPHGAACRFAHGVAELRGGAAPSAAGRKGLGLAPNTEQYTMRKVFVGGLPYTAGSEDLWEEFEELFGRVVDAVVMVTADEGGKPRSRGFGFVVFEDPRHAEEAVRRHHLPFQGRMVEVKRVQPQPHHLVVGSLAPPPVASGHVRGPTGGPEQMPPGQWPAGPPPPAAHWPPPAAPSGAAGGSSGGGGSEAAALSNDSHFPAPLEKLFPSAPQIGPSTPMPPQQSAWQPLAAAGGAGAGFQEPPPTPPPALWAGRDSPHNGLPSHFLPPQGPPPPAVHAWQHSHSGLPPLPPLPPPAEQESTVVITTGSLQSNTAAGGGPAPAGIFPGGASEQGTGRPPHAYHGEQSHVYGGAGDPRPAAAAAPPFGHVAPQWAPSGWRRPYAPLSQWSPGPGGSAYPDAIMAQSAPHYGLHQVAPAPPPSAASGPAPATAVYPGGPPFLQHGALAGQAVSYYPGIPGVSGPPRQVEGSFPWEPTTVPEPGPPHAYTTAAGGSSPAQQPPANRQRAAAAQPAGWPPLPPPSAGPTTLPQPWQNLPQEQGSGPDQGSGPCDSAEDDAELASLLALLDAGPPGLSGGPPPSGAGPLGAGHESWSGPDGRAYGSPQALRSGHQGSSASHATPMGGSEELAAARGPSPAAAAAYEWQGGALSAHGGDRWPHARRSLAPSLGEEAAQDAAKFEATG